MPNRLAAAASPYLLQHRDNPVDWYEWGEEAFAAARDRDVPVFLSVGYSACHWCHVMAHESFEDPATAAFLNEHFVSIKVDREERPDVDRIYMEAVQAMTGRGGWPMSAFLTPGGEPFYAGTYFPPEDRHGLPSFRRLLEALASAWQERRDGLVSQAARITNAIRSSLPTADPGDGPDLRDAYRFLEQAFDPRDGGFGGAPKFPQPATLEFLLRIADKDWAPSAVAMVEHTLTAMARGGIYDHVGGGFARYSVDARWLVPHFEKMLYDNALLARLYLRGWQVTGNDMLRRVAVETLEYLRRDLMHPDGGFYSAEDADAEGVEGKFYVWTWDEFTEIAGDLAIPAADAWGVRPEGNFEGASILHLPNDPGDVAARHGLTKAGLDDLLAAVRARLFERRSGRVRPGLDDKVVTAWNGFALRAFAEAGAVLDDPAYLEIARSNAGFLLDNLRRTDGRLMRSWRKGAVSVPGFCEDYAAASLGLFALYQATGEGRWYDHASVFATDLMNLFADSDSPGFFGTGHDAERLIARPKPVLDNPTPSDNALAGEALLTMVAYTGDGDARAAAAGALQAAGTVAARYPAAAGWTLALRAEGPGERQVAIVGPPDPARRSLQSVVWESFRPDVVLAVSEGDTAAAHPLLVGRTPHEGPALAYVCRDFACDLPTGDPAVLRSQLGIRG